MPRLHGYSPRGDRCYGICDWGAKGRTNVIGAQLGKSLLTVSMFDGTINSDVFASWVANDLLPKAPNGSVMVMDNAAFHKRQDIIDLIAGAGHCIEFLPPYSPDLNDVEHKWAEAKSARRKFRCSISTLFTEHIN